jgi:hypothetical protein
LIYRTGGLAMVFLLVGIISITTLVGLFIFAGTEEEVA